MALGLYVLSVVVDLAIRQHDADEEAGYFGDPVGFGQYTEARATMNSSKGAW
jgi:hypothetical protein